MVLVTIRQRMHWFHHLVNGIFCSIYTKFTLTLVIFETNLNPFIRKLSKYLFVDRRLTLVTLASLVVTIAWLENSNPLVLLGSIKFVDRDSLIINLKMAQ